MSDYGAEGAKLFVIVARDELELHEHVRRQFVGDPQVQVILDRRVGEPWPPDDGRGERRRPRPGQEVPADVPIAIRPRCNAPSSPPPEAPRGRPGESHDGQPGRLPPEDAAAFRTVLRAIDSALAVARPLSVLLRQRHFRRHAPPALEAHSGPINAPEGVRPGLRSPPGPAPGP